LKSAACGDLKERYFQPRHPNMLSIKNLVATRTYDSCSTKAPAAEQHQSIQSECKRLMEPSAYYPRKQSIQTNPQAYAFAGNPPLFINTRVAHQVPATSYYTPHSATANIMGYRPVYNTEPTQYIPEPPRSAPLVQTRYPFEALLQQAPVSPSSSSDDVFDPNNLSDETTLTSNSSRRMTSTAQPKVRDVEKPFSCKCGVNFLRKHDLRRHERIHAGQKPFKCPRCGKGFSRKDGLRYDFP